MSLSQGFEPVARSDARVLILGSLPGQRSLDEQQYYAHPRNAFWGIMRDLFGIDGDYEQRCKGLESARIALWDVLQASVRRGSLDADIQLETANANDFAAFFSRHPGIELIVFNGKKSEALFRKLVRGAGLETLAMATLPSTSPAYAAMTYSGKLKAWRAALQLIQETDGPN
tara:strand:+ start:60351 stop:60866 length:516 start_codon:yes stop_codon:yes gene_type:complete